LLHELTGTFDRIALTTPASIAFVVVGTAVVGNFVVVGCFVVGTDVVVGFGVEVTPFVVVGTFVVLNAVGVPCDGLTVLVGVLGVAVAGVLEPSPEQSAFLLVSKHTHVSTSTHCPLPEHAAVEFPETPKHTGI
jgi:hypothetical protein